MCLNSKSFLFLPRFSKDINKMSMIEKKWQKVCNTSFKKDKNVKDGTIKINGGMKGRWYVDFGLNWASFGIHFVYKCVYQYFRHQWRSWPNSLRGQGGKVVSTLRPGRRIFFISPRWAFSKGKSVRESFCSKFYKTIREYEDKFTLTLKTHKTWVDLIQLIEFSIINISFGYEK